MTTRALKLNKAENPMIFYGICLGLILFALLYVFLINRTVVNVAARQRAEKTISALSSKTGELEASYMSMKNSIDLNLAHSLGFSATISTKYINRTTLGQLSSHPVE